MICLEQVSATSRVRHGSAPVTLFCLGLLSIALIAPVVPGAFLVMVSAWGMAWGIARVPVFFSLRFLSLPLGFLIVSLCTLCVSIQYGSEGLSCHWVSSQIPLAMHTGLRSIAALSATLSMALCIPMGRLLSFLRTLRVPEYVLEFMLLMYRMVFLLDSSRRQIWHAQKNRLGDVSLRSTFRSLSLLIAVLFIQSQNRGMRMEQGLAARCCTGGFAVLTSPQPPISRRVWGLVLIWLMALFGISFGWRANVF